MARPENKEDRKLLITMSVEWVAMLPSGVSTYQMVKQTLSRKYHDILLETNKAPTRYKEKEFKRLARKFSAWKKDGTAFSIGVFEQLMYEKHMKSQKYENNFIDLTNESDNSIVQKWSEKLDLSFQEIVDSFYRGRSILSRFYPDDRRCM